MEFITEHKTMLIVIAIIFLIDFLTGVTKALYNKNFSSEKFRKTIPKVISYVAVLAIAMTLDYYFELNVLVTGCGTFIIITEATSIIENVNEFVSIPDVLTKFLESKKEPKQ